MDIRQKRHIKNHAKLTSYTVLNSLLKVSLIQTTISVKTTKHEWVKTRRISRSKIWYAYSADILFLH